MAKWHHITQCKLIIFGSNNISFGAKLLPKPGVKCHGCGNHKFEVNEFWKLIAIQEVELTEAELKKELKLILVNDSWRICEIVLRWMLQNLMNHKSIFYDNI